MEVGSLAAYIHGRALCPLKRIRDRRVQVSEQLLLTGSYALSKSSGEHLKVQTLVKKVFGTTPGKLRYLWVKPSYTYYKDEFYDGGVPAKQDDPTYNPVKFLVFSHWKFVPKTISVLFGHEAENAWLYAAGGAKPSPSNFVGKLSFSPFEVSYPSLPLADCINPAELALARAGKLTAEEFYARAEQSVRCLLGESGIAIGKTHISALADRRANRGQIQMGENH